MWVICLVSASEQLGPGSLSVNLKLAFPPWVHLYLMGHFKYFPERDKL